jgi:hypothetical protein
MVVEPLNAVVHWLYDQEHFINHFSMIIHRQGHLDALCGIYSVINSLSLLLNHQLDSKALFAYLIRHLRHSIAANLVEGFSLAEQINALRLGSRYLMTRQDVRLRFHSRSANTLQQYWHGMRSHYQQHGAGSIVLSINEGYNHWTCVRHITERTIVFADSDEADRLRRSNITIKRPTKKRAYKLLPKETFLLSLHR